MPRYRFGLFGSIASLLGYINLNILLAVKMIFGGYLWIWSTDNFLGNNAEANRLVAVCKRFNIKNVFLDFNPYSYVVEKQNLRGLLGKLNNNGIRPWGLAGSRNYMSDADGPEEILTAVDNLIKYNDQVKPNERYYGFQTDIEIHDNGKYFSFHNDLSDKELSKYGGGVWQSTEYLDRRALTADWLNTHALLKSKLYKKGLKLGAAIPFWFDDYNGAPVVTRFKKKTAGLFDHIARIADEIHIMSYNTNPASVVQRVANKMKYLSLYTKVKACASVETNSDVDLVLVTGITLKRII